MKYISLDIETCGLNKDKHSIIQVGWVIDDLSELKPIEDLRRESFFVYNENICADINTIEWHKKNGLWDKWLDCRSLLPLGRIESELVKSITEEFGLDHYLKNKINFAGKNLAGFDIPFLSNGSIAFKQFFDKKASHRVISPDEYFFDLTKDEVKPSLQECKRRAGFEDTEVTHEALDDALDVVRLIRWKYNRQLEDIPVAHER